MLMEVGDPYGLFCSSNNLVVAVASLVDVAMENAKFIRAEVLYLNHLIKTLKLV